MSKQVFLSEKKGQSVIEFAMMLPIFLLVMMVSLGACFGIYYKLVMNQLIMDVARVISVSDNETTSVIDMKIEGILEAYENHGSFLLNTTDDTLFTLSWTTQTEDVVYKVVIVNARYTGLRLPFIGIMPISDRIIFPYVDHGTGI